MWSLDTHTHNTTHLLPFLIPTPLFLSSDIPSVIAVIPFSSPHPMRRG